MSFFFALGVPISRISVLPLSGLQELGVHFLGVVVNDGQEREEKIFYLRSHRESI
jgi:hypothetical protein